MHKLIEQSKDDITDIDYEDVSGLENDLDQELNSIFADFGGDDIVDEYEIRVYRVQPGKAALGYLFACLPSELPILDKLRDEYGGGDFEVRILKNKKIFRRRKTIVEPPVKKAIQPAAASSDLVAVVQAMNTGFQKLGELISNNANSQQVSPVTLQGEILQNMLSMKELLGAGDNQRQESPIKMLAELVELQKSLGVGEGGASTADVLLSMANQVLPKLADMGQQESRLKTIAARRRGQKRLRSTTDNPMKMHLVFLCAQAAAGRDPELYAQMVIDNTPADKVAELKSFIAGPDALTNMAAVHQGVLAHKDWFYALAENILALIGDTPESIPPQNVPAGEPTPGMVGVETIAVNGAN